MSSKCREMRGFSGFIAGFVAGKFFSGSLLLVFGWQFVGPPRLFPPQHRIAGKDTRRDRCTPAASHSATPRHPGTTTPDTVPLCRCAPLSPCHPETVPPRDRATPTPRTPRHPGHPDTVPPRHRAPLHPVTRHPATRPHRPEQGEAPRKSRTHGGGGCRFFGVVGSLIVVAPEKIPGFH